MMILGSVAAICAIGLVASHYVDWPVNSDDASGDIAKSARFSRKQATEKLTNMEELLKNDTAYKDGIVTAHVVMQTRAIQFGALVDMSNEVGANIPELADVLKDMNEARKMVVNVNASLSKAGEDLNAALNGEDCPDLTQNTINASLAYTTLQKQNTLANRFIDATDQYLETAKGDNRLKFVRDQWVDYQTMTAALDGNKESADALASKGNLLPAEQSLAAMQTFNVASQAAILQNCNLSKKLNIHSKLVNALPADQLSMSNTKYHELMASVKLDNTAGKKLENSAKMLNQSNSDLLMATAAMYNASKVLQAYDNALSNLPSTGPLNQQQRVVCSQVGDLINQTAAGLQAKYVLFR